MIKRAIVHEMGIADDDTDSEELGIDAHHRPKLEQRFLLGAAPATKHHKLKAAPAKDVGESEHEQSDDTSDDAGGKEFLEATNMETDADFRGKFRCLICPHKILRTEKDRDRHPDSKCHQKSLKRLEYAKKVGIETYLQEMKVIEEKGQNLIPSNRKLRRQKKWEEYQQKILQKKTEKKKRRSEENSHHQDVEQSAVDKEVEQSWVDKEFELSAGDKNTQGGVATEEKAQKGKRRKNKQGSCDATEGETQEGGPGDATKAQTQEQGRKRKAAKKQRKTKENAAIIN